jgi:Fructose-bisphosphate aldolase class-II
VTRGPVPWLPHEEPPFRDQKCAGKQASRRPEQVLNFENWENPKKQLAQTCNPYVISGRSIPMPTLITISLPSAVKDAENETREKFIVAAENLFALHGGVKRPGHRGSRRRQLVLALEEGVVKINIRAAIFEAWIAGLREGLDPAASDKSAHEPLHYSVTRQGMRRVTEVARERIRCFRASGKTPALRQLLSRYERTVA